MALMCALVFQRRLHLVPLGCDVNQAVMNIDFYFFLPWFFSHSLPSKRARSPDSADVSSDMPPPVCGRGPLIEPVTRFDEIQRGGELKI